MSILPLQTLLRTLGKTDKLMTVEESNLYGISDTVKMTLRKSWDTDPY